MKIYDITQELIGCAVYPGDRTPEFKLVNNMNNGDLYNLSDISLCTHNGTHIDAPFHFISDGKTVNEISIEKFVGPCYVLCHNGDFTAEHVNSVKETNNGMLPERLLISGNVTITADAAKEFADSGIFLLGNESQTIGPEQAPMEVHKILLEKEIVLLEGIRLSGIEQGYYFLCAAPINISGSDGAPCRAILIKF